MVGLKNFSIKKSDISSDLSRRDACRQPVKHHALKGGAYGVLAGQGRKRTGGWASAGFGETLWRHLFLSNCRNEPFWKRSRSSVSTVIHSSEDPPCRGSEKTTLTRPPPVNAYCVSTLSRPQQCVRLVPESPLKYLWCTNTETLGQ
jgi:hypothetical protein